MSGAIPPLLYAFMAYTGTTLPLQSVHRYCKWSLPFKLSVQCFVCISHFCHICLHGTDWEAIDNYSRDRYQIAVGANGVGLLSGIFSDFMWWKRCPYFHRLQNSDVFYSLFPPTTPSGDSVGLVGGEWFVSWLLGAFSLSKSKFL
jgi:hypothetical protein